MFLFFNTFYLSRHLLSSNYFFYIHYMNGVRSISVYVVAIWDSYFLVEFIIFARVEIVHSHLNGNECKLRKSMEHKKTSSKEQTLELN